MLKPLSHNRLILNIEPSNSLLSAPLTEDEGELTFDEDERITNIEQIDDGWWRGVRELDGSHGIFPANYVQLV